MALLKAVSFAEVTRVKAARADCQCQARRVSWTVTSIVLPGAPW